MNMYREKQNIYLLDSPREKHEFAESDKIIAKLEEISKEFYSLSYINEIESPRNSNNKTQSNYHLYLQLYNMLKTLVSLSSYIVDENKGLKNQIIKIEHELKGLNKENYEMAQEISKLNNFIAELKRNTEETERLAKHNVIFQDNEEKFKDKISKLESCLKEYENNMKILEIEKDEAFSRNENLLLKFEEESVKCKTLKKNMNDKDKEINLIKKKLEQFNKKINTTNTPTTIGSDLTKSYSSNPPIKDDCYSTNFSFPKYELRKMNTIAMENYESSLSSLYPELNDDECSKFNQHQEVKIINITPSEVVRKMSRSQTSSICINNISEKELSEMKYNITNQEPIYLSTQTSSVSVSNNESDIYKDFFLLTFQSIKLNIENIEPILKVNPNTLYKKVVSKNIPFHKFSDFIYKEFESNF